MYLSYCVALVTRLACCLRWVFLSLQRSFGQRKLEAVTVKIDPISTLHALVIGIDTYPNQPHLTGAHADANTIEDFLINVLGTPPPHIINLRDAEATRANIIDGFRRLRDNPQIERGSPILIYFAGHGGVEHASEKWKERYKITSKIQVIFPYDYGETCNGKVVNCIPDKTVAWLLNELAEAKGNNITVIFDSCHSASGNRVPGTVGGRQARAAKVKMEIPVDIDDDIIFQVPGSTDSAPRYTGSPFSAHQASHVHLAACGSNEHAWEEDGRGEFTAALLKTIRAHGVDKATYRNLIVGLPYLAKQTPHCYGAHRGRLLFDGRVASRNVAFVPVLYDPNSDNKTLTLQAGVASGVTRGSVWELRRYAILGDEEILGTATAASPGISLTKLNPVEEADEFSRLFQSGTPYEGGKTKLYARLVNAGPGNELKVWFSPEASKLIFADLGGEDPQAKDRVTHEFDYVAHPFKDTADMLVTVYKQAEGNPGSVQALSSGSGTQPEVEFTLGDIHAQKYGVATLPRRKSASLGEVETVLFAAARWNWYLQYTNHNHTSALVGMKMFKIAERRPVKGGYSNDFWRPVPESERGNMNQTGVVDFEVDKKNLYALQLKSEVDKPLYVRVFYFDMTRLSIDDQFGHDAANGRADPMIIPRGEFTIGDDVEGGTPIPFELDPGDKVDIGCMKVFWSTDPLELDGLAQDSVFDPKRKVAPKLTRPEAQKGDWGTTSLMLVQREPRNDV